MNEAWWKSAVIYQIYPWSFQDSNGDGIGDLPGIISRLDYLNDGTEASLGVDAIWLSPIYTSPMRDFGYDVADYCDIDPRFGTLRDFDQLVMGAHKRGIRVLMDLVLNHTSDQHPWFIDSRSSSTSPKADWYHWVNPTRTGGPPSNWQAVFGGSAWQWDSGRNQYYLHSFLKEQPDLNWNNPLVCKAMHDVVRFWLERGVDGFRLDAVNWIGKDTRWPDNPRRWGWRAYTRQRHRFDRDQPDAHRVLRGVRSVTDSYPDKVLVGEASADTMGGPAAFYGNGHDELHLVFNFHLLKSVWRADDVRRIVRTWDESIPEGAWPTQVLSNHDQPRHFNRYGRGVGEEVAARRGRAAALLLLTLRGTPFLYYGEEIGMRDTPLAYRDLKDPYTRRYWPFMKGRDPARTPMRWDPSAQAGFTTGRPWLPIGADTDRVNVACEAADPTSMFSLYRRIIRIRKSSPALQLGAYHEVPCAHQDWFVYMRSTGMGGHGTERMLVAMNFGDQSGTFAVQSVSSSGRIVLSTDPASHETAFNAACVQLGPEEGILVRLE